jgi:TPR repeat protein
LRQKYPFDENETMRLILTTIRQIFLPIVLVLLAAPALAQGTVEDGIKAYQAEDYTKAYKILLPHANTYAKPGFIQAQWLVGNLYLAGKAVEKSIPKAWVWHQKAINNAYDVKNYALIQEIIKPYLDNNLTEGKVEYAKLLMHAGDEEQRKQAQDFIIQAAKAGNAVAQYEMSKLGGGFANNIEKFQYEIKWLKSAAEQGYAPAQIAYGREFRHGGPAFTQKIFPEEVWKNWPKEEAAQRKWKKEQHIKWALKAADLGYAEGAFAAANAYKNSDNWEKAIPQYARSAKLGHLKAQFELAVAYDKGLGVTQNRQRAANLNRDILDRIGDLPQDADSLWLHIRSYADLNMIAIRRETGIEPKTPQKPNWLVGKWGTVEEDGKGGYRESTDLLGNACADHNGRGYATFSFKDNALIADIIGNTAAAIMFDVFEEAPAPYTALDDTHVEVYPAQWGDGWLMLEHTKPEVLKVVVHGGDSSDRNFFLKLCGK